MSYPVGLVSVSKYDGFLYNYFGGSN